MLPTALLDGADKKNTQMRQKKKTHKYSTFGSDPQWQTWYNLLKNYNPSTTSRLLLRTHEFKHPFHQIVGAEFKL